MKSQPVLEHPALPGRWSGGRHRCTDGAYYADFFLKQPFKTQESCDSAVILHIAKSKGSHACQHFKKVWNSPSAARMTTVAIMISWIIIGKNLLS